jgi:hypothetical protein
MLDRLTIVDPISSHVFVQTVQSTVTGGNAANANLREQGICRDHDTVTIPCDLHSSSPNWSGQALGQAPYIETKTHSLRICGAPFDSKKTRPQIDILLGTTSVTCTAQHNRNLATDNTTRHSHDSDSCIPHSFDALRFNGLPARSPSSTGKGTGKVKLRYSDASILETSSNVLQ